MESGPEVTGEELVLLLAARDARIAAQDAVIAVLSDRIAQVEAQASRGSSNSSKPPSSDSPFTKKPAKPRSSRTRSGTKPGK